MPAFRLRRSAAFLLVVLALLLPAAQPASGAEDPESERERVRQEQSEVDAQIDVLRASEDELAAELDRLASELSGAQADLANAQAAVEAAEERVARIDRELEDLDDQTTQLTADFEEAAVESYIGGGGDQPLIGLAEQDPNRAVVREALLDVTRGDMDDLLDALHGVEAEREQARGEAEEARQAAGAARDAASARLNTVEAAQAAQQAVAADVEARIDNALYEAAALEEQDQALSDEIREQQEELARRLPPPPPPPPSLPPPSAPPTGPPPTPPTLPTPPGGIVTVAGIQVAASIAPQVEGLMAKASEDGVPLGGSGYRDPQAQIDLRMQNCGTSYYAIYEMPPDQCSPETAIPGRSKHEVGLAIDFTWGGQIITSRSSVGFQWMAANAPSFGFANLPSEAWHWSTDGT